MMSHNEFLLLQIGMWLVAGFGIFCLIRIIVAGSRMGEDSYVGCVLSFIFLGLGVGGGATAVLFETDYSVKNTKNFHPTETTLMYDDYEVVIKYGNDRRFTISDKRKYERVMDSCFYIEQNTYYDIFDNVETTEHNLITFDSDKPANNPIKIEL